MTDRETLIEDAAKAMWAANGPEEWERATGAEQAEHLTLASAALAVFEKAYTPTDDEREALARLVDPGAFIPFDPVVVDPRWPEEVEHRQREARHHADRIYAAGFRRSEVPEPSAEDQGAAASCHLCVGAGGYEDPDGEWVECSCQRAEPQGEPSDANECEHIDAEIGATCQNFYDTPCETGDCGESYCWTCNACGVCKANAAEPQGEPSDIAIRNHGGWDMGLQSKSYPPDRAVDAALKAWNTTGGSDRVAMRAALRAGWDAK